MPAGGPDAVVGRLRGTGRWRVLLAGHLDTVFAASTGTARPFAVDASGLARGTGVCDNIGGVLAGIAAIEVLRDVGCTSFGEIVLLATPDEEIGSPDSRGCSSRWAPRPTSRSAWSAPAPTARSCWLQGSRRPGRAGAGLGGPCRHRTQGRVSAALAVTRPALAVDAVNGHWEDVTVNAGVLRAGERANVAAADGVLLVEVRASRTAHFEVALAVIRELVAAGTAVRGQRPTQADSSYTSPKTEAISPSYWAGMYQHARDADLHWRREREIAARAATSQAATSQAPATDPE